MPKEQNENIEEPFHGAFPPPKDTNPKDAIGVTKAPLSTLSMPVVYEMALSMLDGSKHGRHNYRVAGVRASVYYDAALRHIAKWWEGENNDPDSGVPHLAHAMSCLMIIRDGELTGLINDDRPPSTFPAGWMLKYDELAKEIVGKGEALPPYVKGDEV